ncbi:MAG: hypothetical protein JXR64_10905 [Spirochaetales bacterium]|nr:hypothetical protein [Spirochaetales bacterium]
MISNSVYRDFLFIHYKYKDFIVDRNRFSSSVSFNKKMDVDIDSKYLKDVIEYGQEKILNFNLDQYLEDIFKIEIDSLSKICIISKIDQFSIKTQELLKKIFSKCNESITRELISFSITSKSEIKKNSIHAFKSLSKIYKDQFEEKGIQYCFFENDRIQYFIDIDKILLNSIGQTGGNDEHNNW